MYRYIVLSALLYRFSFYSFFIIHRIYCHMNVLKHIHTFGVASSCLATEKTRKISRIHSATMIDFEPSILFVFCVFFLSFFHSDFVHFIHNNIADGSILCSEQSYLIISSSFCVFFRLLLLLCCHHQIAILTHLAIYENEKDTQTHTEQSALTERLMSVIYFYHS